MNMEIGSNELQIELNEYSNWIETIQKLNWTNIEIESAKDWLDLKIELNK